MRLRASILTMALSLALVGCATTNRQHTPNSPGLENVFYNPSPYWGKSIELCGWVTNVLSIHMSTMSNIRPPSSGNDGRTVSKYRNKGYTITSEARASVAVKWAGKTPSLKRSRYYCLDGKIEPLHGFDEKGEPKKLADERYYSLLFVQDEE